MSMHWEQQAISYSNITDFESCQEIFIFCVQKFEFGMSTNLLTNQRKIYTMI